MRTSRTKDGNNRANHTCSVSRDARPYNFNEEYRTDDFAPQRGLEEVVERRYPEAMKANGRLNKISGLNPLRRDVSVCRDSTEKYRSERGGTK